MDQDIYDELTTVARHERTISYENLSLKVGLNMALEVDRIRIARTLDEIHKHEAELERPMISALIVHKGDGYPGRRFYECARDLRRLRATDEDSEVEFWVREVRAVYNYWGS